jgi:hypothetical protein
MPTPRLIHLLTLTLLLALAVSCAPHTGSSLPTANPTVSPPTPTPFLQPTRSTRAPASDQGKSATQNLPYEVPSHPIDMILGRPTDSSITVSILAYQDAEGYLEYGPASDVFSIQTQLTPFGADQPVEILVAGLQANTAYTYRVRYRSSSMGDFTATDQGTFSTQRAAGSTFTFTIQADSHLDSNSSLQVYEQTLANQLADQPDFVIDLGDTFMTDKFRPYTDAQLQYLAQRYYFSMISQDAPLFLVLGNHDGEGTPNDSSTEIPFWSTQMRMKYFPNPIPNDFYTGNSTIDPTLGTVRDGFYAWNWGDALFMTLDPYWYTTDKPKPDEVGDNWFWTLGKGQYEWLKTTLETSQAKFKFVFIHHLVGGAEGARGGIEYASLYEWGGYNTDGYYGFDEQRPGWGVPIHQLLVANNVSAVFHGHDHVFVQQELDGIIYQEVPQPSSADNNKTGLATDYGYVNGVILGSSGHLRVTVAPQEVTVDYVRAYLPQDDTAIQHNGTVDYSYTIK